MRTLLVRVLVRRSWWWWWLTNGRGRLIFDAYFTVERFSNSCKRAKLLVL